MALVSKFQCFNILECACPAVIKSERLGKRLTDDVACFVRKEELRVKRNDFDCEGGALGRELGIEGFQMKEDCLFGLLHFLCALAGDGDENEMFLIHDYTRLNIKQQLKQLIPTTFAAINSLPRQENFYFLPHSAVASSVGRVSIIMLQKVAANVHFVAADLCFMACKVR